MAPSVRELARQDDGVDAVILDVMLPQKDGWGVIESARACLARLDDTRDTLQTRALTSFLGYTTYKMSFATREGLLPAIGLLPVDAELHRSAELQYRASPRIT